MLAARLRTASWVGAAVVLCTIIACTATVSPDDGTIKISNGIFSVKLGASGVFELSIRHEIK